jgi:Fe-S oxidoreductase/nitrate reductase gamma subunit
MNLDPVGQPVALGALWILVVLSFGIFGWRISRIVQAMRRARKDNRFDHLPARFAHFVQNVLLQRRIFNERAIGWPHFLIFWGFMLYAACFNWALVRGLFPILPIPYPDEVKGVGLFLEIFAVIVLVALGFAAARRLFYPPPRLHLSLDANLILVLIGLLMVSTLLGQGMRLVAEGGHSSAWNPVGSLLANAFQGVAGETAAAVAKAMWWVHMLGVMVFLVYLPFSKHLHLLGAPFNVFFANPHSPASLDASGVPEEFTAGAARWDEFTWKQLLCGFSCAECGRCDRICPGQVCGYALSPQDLIQRVKQHFLGAALGAAKPVRSAIAPAPVTPAAGADAASPLAGGLVKAEEVWNCTTCGACMECCAVWNEQVPIIVQMRRHLVGQGAVERGVQDVLDKLNRYGNSFGKSDRMRARWVQNAGLKIKDARKEPVDYVWFVGDYASFDPRVEEVTRKTARIFERAGMNFGILYEGERNSGNDVRRVGEEGLFEVLRDKNLQSFEKVQWKNGHKTIVTTDPHSYNALKNEYHFDGNGVTVLHYTELLDQLAGEGRLPVGRELASRVAYHDPCYLGRYNGVYDPPRRLLRRLGATVVEMPRNRGRSFCCGAGGGRIWMEDTPGIKERPAESRIREAATLTGVSTLVVSCPKDIAMFRDAVKTTGHEGKIAVKDVVDLVWEAMQEETSTTTPR